MFKFKGILTGVAVATLIWTFNSVSGVSGCGGSSSRGGTGGSGTTTGTADVSSLRTVPNTDLSSLDVSQSSASGLRRLALSVVNKAKHEEFKDNLRSVGNPSRAGCESNMHKKQIIRDSKMAQFPKCMAQAMEKSGLITIPTGSLAYYKMTPPPETEEQKAGMCNGIPDERMEDKRACEEEANQGPQEIKLRIGNVDGLQMDVCFGGVLEEEALYTAAGSLYTATLAHGRTFQGKSEKANFSMTVDLGTTGTVTEGRISLGNGNASATGQMNGGFGRGLIRADVTADTFAIQGGFLGDFVDPFTGVATSFIGKTYSKLNATEGCAKFSFEGPPPPMRIQDMVPFDVSADALGGFLQAFSQELCGVVVNADNYGEINVCPNPDFDPTAAGETDCPMIAAAADGGCPTVTHTGTECFSISNGSTTTDFGRTRILQTFLRTDESTARFFTEVNAFDLGPLDPSSVNPAFSRNWDCTGDFSELNFANGQNVEENMEDCFALEEEMREDNGFGDYNCQGQEMANGAGDLSKEGPPDNGRFGGDLERQTTTCADGQTPGHIMVNPVNLDTNEYCIPTERSCEPLGTLTNMGNGTLLAGANGGLSITMPGHLAITGVGFQTSGPTAPATGAQISFGGTIQAPQCTGTYGLRQPNFEPPPEFGSDPPGGEGGVPQACIDRFGDDVTREECEAFCGRPENGDLCRQ